MSQLPWPDTLLEASAWPAIRRLIDRCLALEASSALPGTLMLVGEAGLGREAAAVELAAGLVCRTRTSAPCDCASCRRVRRGVHPDLDVVDVLPDKKLISIEQARDIVDHASQLPFEGRRRVCILSSGHTPPLGADAAAALLKTLEEPPSHLTMILLASNPSRVLPTIVSRSVQVRVPRPTYDEAVAMLAQLRGCDHEKAVELFAAWSGDVAGAPRDGEEIGTGELSAQREVLRKAVAGDGLAILQAANAIASKQGGVALAVTALEQLAGADASGGGESMIGAAVALLAAAHRSAVLNLDLEAAVAGALATLAMQRQPHAVRH